jgi:hypothetical protein
VALAGLCPRAENADIGRALEYLVVPSRISPVAGRANAVWRTGVALATGRRLPVFALGQDLRLLGLKLFLREDALRFQVGQFLQLL